MQIEVRLVVVLQSSVYLFQYLLIISITQMYGWCVQHNYAYCLGQTMLKFYFWVAKPLGDCTIECIRPQGIYMHHTICISCHRLVMHAYMLSCIMHSTSPPNVVQFDPWTCGGRGRQIQRLRWKRGPTEGHQCRSKVAIVAELVQVQHVNHKTFVKCSMSVTHMLGFNDIQ